MSIGPLPSAALVKFQGPGWVPDKAGKKADSHLENARWMWGKVIQIDENCHYTEDAPTAWSIVDYVKAFFLFIPAVWGLMRGNLILKKSTVHEFHYRISSWPKKDLETLSYLYKICVEPSVQTLEVKVKPVVQNALFLNRIIKPRDVVALIDSELKQPNQEIKVKSFIDTIYDKDNPDHAFLLRQRGLLHKAMGNRSQAWADFEAFKKTSGYEVLPDAEKKTVEIALAEVKP